MYFCGMLFDLDGTLVNSLDFVEASWSAWADRKGLNPQTVRNYLHGKPAVNTLRYFLPDASDAEIEQEFLTLEDYEARNTNGITAVAGAGEFLNRLNSLAVPWGIVTSGSRKVASARIRHAKLPFPLVLITSEDIQRGKPEPAPFLRGAERLNVPASCCIAFEDSRAGLLSARKAGTVVVEVVTPQSTAHDIITFATISNYLGLDVSHTRGGDFLLRL